MTENAKTIVFVLIGLIAVGLGLATRPSSGELNVETLVGQNLPNNKFKAPEEAKKLQIVRFDEDTATRDKFEVAEQNGLWVIPSKDGYPADAARQMAEAATSLMDRKILAVVGNSAGDHEQYGVVDPLSPKLEVGQKGVGARVTMLNGEGAPLVDLIIGKVVKGTEGRGAAEGQRYVREAGRDVVYTIEIDPSKLSTKFENWIEKDLLKLSAWDLKQVQIKDYSAELMRVLTRDGHLGYRLKEDQRSDLTLAYDDSKAKWTPVALRRYEKEQGKNGAYVDFTLAEDEELNEKTLNDLKNALADLKIVDVVRKPAGLSNDLKAGADFLNNEETLSDLAEKGFTAVPGPGGGSPEIVSSDGEVIATMKNGTEYVLRFGNLTESGSAHAEESGGADPTPDAAKPKEKSKDGGVNRYLFVMARFDESAVKKPDFKPLPDLPGTEKTEKPADAAKDAAQPSAEPKKDAEPKGPGADPDPSAENKDAPAEEKPADAEKSKTDEKSDVDKIMAERKLIEQENQRKNDEYQELLKKGQENVTKLNLRFGDWYFVVDDTMFHKIRLGRDEVIKKKEKKEGEANPRNAATPGGAIPGLPEIPGVKKKK